MMTLESSHDIEIIEVEPQQQGNDEIEQGAATQEPASLNVLVQVADQMGGEPGIEGTLEFYKELCTTTLVLLLEEVIQDVVTQEPTSLKVAGGNLEMQQENNPEVDVIPDMDWSEDEQVQTQPSGDTEILEE